jgi:hypothetical protein
LTAALESLWAALPLVENWNARDGGTNASPGASPFVSANFLSLLLLARLPLSNWAAPSDVERWVLDNHPFWATSGGQASRNQKHKHSPVTTFLLGVAYPLRLVEISKGDGEPLVRLTALARWLLGAGSKPGETPGFPKTIVVQPNLEIVAYRQGLTPDLITSLSLFATWKSLGAACTLQLQPESVYRALEAGWKFERILQILEQYGMRPTPPAVIESLRTWANKRDRLSVYPSAALFEFATNSDLEAALSRGLPAVRLTDRLVVVANESAIDFRHFRLNGTRDYALPPDQCVDVDDDGVTLTIDPVRADLLLETELRRFAEPLDRPGPNGRRQYRVTPHSLTLARQLEMGIETLDEWFLQRTGRPLTPAARMLLGAGTLSAFSLKTELVLKVNSAETADGLLQWPPTRGLFQARLGPTALVVAQADLETLRERLRSLGISIPTESAEC